MYYYYLIRLNKDGKLHLVAATDLSCYLPCVVIGFCSFSSPLSLVQQVGIVNSLLPSDNDINKNDNVED